MILLIDIGNTNIVLGVHDGSELISTWRMQTDTLKTADEYMIVMKQFLEQQCQMVQQAVISSVVPKMTTIFTRVVIHLFGVTPFIINHTINLGITLGVESPESVGADLIVGAVAAHAKYQKTCIIVDMGTATTITTVTESGEFQGGAIAPGVELASAALFQNAAKIADFPLLPPPNVIGKSTQHAVQSGIIFGYTGLVDGIIERMAYEYQGQELIIIATGGQARIISEYSKFIQIFDEHLLFTGMKILFDLNH